MNYNRRVPYWKRRWGGGERGAEEFVLEERTSATCLRTSELPIENFICRTRARDVSISRRPTLFLSFFLSFFLSSFHLDDLELRSD